MDQSEYAPADGRLLDILSFVRDHGVVAWVADGRIGLIIPWTNRTTQRGIDVEHGAEFFVVQTYLEARAVLGY